jgi:predicted ATPase
VISRIKIENFKAFAFLDLPLARLSLLTGLNAAGKSTTMQALALLRQSQDAGLLIREGGLLLNGELVTLGVGGDVLHEDYHATPSGRPRIGFTVTCDGQDASWYSTYELTRDREADLLQIDVVPKQPLQVGPFAPNFQYLRADRVAPAVTYEKSYDAAVRRVFLGAQGEHTANYLRVHRDDPVSPALRLPGILSTALLDHVEGWLQELCPGVNVNAEDLAGTDSVLLSYGFFGRTGASSSNRYRPTNVGFGLTYALPIVVACLIATPGSLVMLENPEAHLHPRGQMMMARLAATAAASGAQVLMETHSDHVLNGVRLAVKDALLSEADVAIHYFHRDQVPRDVGGRVPQVSVVSPEISSDGMLSDWPKGFFDEWDKALDRLLD